MQGRLARASAAVDRRGSRRLPCVRRGTHAHRADSSPIRPRTTWMASISMRTFHQMNGYRLQADCAYTRGFVIVCCTSVNKQHVHACPLVVSATHVGLHGTPPPPRHLIEMTQTILFVGRLVSQKTARKCIELPEFQRVQTLPRFQKLSLTQNDEQICLRRM